MKVTENFVTGAMFADYVDWRAEHPSDDIMTELLNVEFTDETGTVRKLTRNELLDVPRGARRRRERDDDRVSSGGPRRCLADHPDQRAELVKDRSLIANAIEEVLRFESPAPHVGRCVAREDLTVLGTHCPGRKRDALPSGLGQPGRSPLSRRGRLRHPSERRPSPDLRERHPPLHGCGPGPPGGVHRPRRGADAVSRMGHRHGQCAAVPDLDRAGLGDASRRASDKSGRRERCRSRSHESARHYDSPLRRQQAVETRERIVAAGCRLLASSSVRDWRALTIRGVADEAGVNERTVYRYFGNEQGLRDAVMHRLEQKAGIDLDGMRLEDVADIAARIFAHVSSYPIRPKPPLDPTLADANLRQRGALFDALEREDRAVARVGPLHRGCCCSTSSGAWRRTNGSPRTGRWTERSGDRGRHLGDRPGRGRGGR